MDWKLFACQNSIHPKNSSIKICFFFFLFVLSIRPPLGQRIGFPFHKLWSVFFILSLSLRWLTDKLTGVVSDIKFGQQRGSQNFLEFRLLWIIFQRIQLETSAQEKKHNLIPHLQLVWSPFLKTGKHAQSEMTSCRVDFRLFPQPSRRPSSSLLYQKSYPKSDHDWGRRILSPVP